MGKLQVLRRRPEKPPQRATSRMGSILKAGPLKSAPKTVECDGSGPIRLCADQIVWRRIAWRKHAARRAMTVAGTSILRYDMRLRFSVVSRSRRARCGSARIAAGKE